MYATREDIRSIYGAEFLSDITPVDGDNPDFDPEAAVDQALVDASAEIDGYLSARYSLPLDVVGDHSYGYAMHWTGDALAVGQPITNTVHPDDLRLGHLRCWGGVKAACYVSSCSDVEIEAMSLDGVQKIAVFFPGDETKAFASPERKDQIGQGLRVGSIRATNCLPGHDQGPEMIDIAAVGSSRFRTDPGENGPITYKRTLKMDIHLGRVSLHTTSNDPAIAGMKVFEMPQGASVRVDHMETRGFPVAANIVRSRGATDIHIAHADGKVIIDRSTARITGGHIHLEELQHTDAVCIDAAGTNTNGILANAVAAGATELTLSEPLGHDAVPGDYVRLGGESVQVTEFCETGKLTLKVDATTKAHAAATSLTLNLQSDVECEANTVGGRTGVRAVGADVVVTGGTPRNMGRDGYLAGVAGRIIVKGAAAMGVGRIKGDPAFSSYTAYAAHAMPKGVIQIEGGYWGRNSDAATALFRVQSDASGPGQIYVNGARIIDTRPLASVTAGGIFKIADSFTDDGAPIVQP